jgi:hypothetical protein
MQNVHLFWDGVSKLCDVISQQPSQCLSSTKGCELYITSNKQRFPVAILAEK